jgi:hypothetical protein
MEDNDGFTLVTASKRTPKQLSTNYLRENAQPEKETKRPDEEMTENETTANGTCEKLRISIKYGSNANPEKGEMSKKGVSRLHELFQITFDIDPLLQLQSISGNMLLHRSAIFPGENDTTRQRNIPAKQTGPDAPITL